MGLPMKDKFLMVNLMDMGLCRIQMGLLFIKEDFQIVSLMDLEYVRMEK